MMHLSFINSRRFRFPRTAYLLIQGMEYASADTSFCSSFTKEFKTSPRKSTNNGAKKSKMKSVRPPRKRDSIVSENPTLVSCLDLSKETKIYWDIPDIDERISKTGSWIKGFRDLCVRLRETKAYAWDSLRRIEWFVNMNDKQPLDMAGKSLSLADARQIFGEMENCGCDPETAALNTFLHVLCESGKTLLAERLWEKLKLNKRTNRIAFRILVNGHCRAGKIGRAFAVFDTISRYGCVDVEAFNALLEGMCRANMFKSAARLLERMEGKGCHPNIATYNILIRSFCKANLIEPAMEVYNLMLGLGRVRPVEETYGPLIHVLCRAGDFDRAFGLYCDMKHFHLEVGQPIYDWLVRCCCRRGGQTCAAFAIELDMGLKDCALDKATYHCLLRKMCQDGMFPELWVLWGRMISTGFDAIKETHTTLVIMFSSKNKQGLAKKIWRAMIKERLIPRNLTWSMFHSKFLKLGGTDVDLKGRITEKDRV